MKATNDEKSLLLFNSYSYSYVDVVMKLLFEFTTFSYTIASYICMCMHVCGMLLQL